MTKISLYTEHIIHHATFAIASSIIQKYTGNNQEVALPGAQLSLAKGLFWDGAREYMKNGKPQWGQLAYDVLGSGIGYYTSTFL